MDKYGVSSRGGHGQLIGALLGSILLSTAAIGYAAHAALADTDVRGSLTASRALPGKQLRHPGDGPRASVAAQASPDVMSIVFADRATAEDFYAEALGNGERVCLRDLGRRRGLRAHGQRWWLHSC